MKNHNRLIKNKEFLLLLSNCEKKIRDAVLNKCSKERILSIVECILNVINGNIQIDPESYEKLKPFNKIFKKILDKKNNFKIKRKLIVQKGGFLQFLIPAIVSGIATIISSSVSKKND